MYLIGYDIGSSSIKTALIHADSQKVIGIAKYPEQEMEIIAPQKGWAEQHPEIWWQHLCQGTQELLSQHRISPTEIKGIGISYQMHGLVLVDQQMQVIRPAIIWCDSRAVAIGQEAFQSIGEDYCLKHFLNSPGNLTASKLRWIKEWEPEQYEQIHKILLPGDYIAMKLTGELHTTISGLSEAILWDFQKQSLAQQVLDHYELDAAVIPEVVPAFSMTGKVHSMAAEQSGLAIGTPVTYRAGDQPNNALSLGVLHQGEVAATCGTSGVVYGIVDQPITDPQSRVNAFAHVNYGPDLRRIGMLLCINGAGSQYRWMNHQVAQSGQDYAAMEQMAEQVAVGSEGVTILPFGNGAERMLADRDIESHIFNLSFNRHTRAHLFRASLEGIAFSFSYGINLLKKMGLAVDVLKVGDDNMFQSKIFSTTMATFLDSPIEVIHTTGAVGAARAAGVAAGLYQTIEEALQRIQVDHVFEPVLKDDRYLEAYQRWLTFLNKMNG